MKLAREIVTHNATCRLEGRNSTILQPRTIVFVSMCPPNNKSLRSPIRVESTSLSPAGPDTEPTDDVEPDGSASRLMKNSWPLGTAAFGIAWSLCLAVGLMNEAIGQDVRYVTRFEQQQRVAYEPQVQIVEQIVSRSGWNPFRPKPKLKRRMVPVVRWVPKAVEEKMPVTERQAVRRPPRSFAQLPIQKIPPGEEPRLASNDRWQPRSELLPAVETTQALPTRSRPWKSAANADQYGGVQRFDEDTPRVGMQLREMR